MADDGTARSRRNLRRSANASHAYSEAAARITQSDVSHADGTWRRDARGVWRQNMDLPTYEGTGLASDAERDP